MMKEIDRVFTKYPFFGSRQIAAYPRREKTVVGSHRVRRLMAKMDLEAICKRPSTSQSYPQHPVYPCLLRKMLIARPNQVWCANITFVPVKNGFLYLVAIMDWATRKVLNWRLSAMIRAALSVLSGDVKVCFPFLLLFLIKAGRGLLARWLLYLGFVTQDWERLFTLMLIYPVYLPFEIILQTLLQAVMSQMTRDTLIKGRISWAWIAGVLTRHLFTLLFIGVISYFVRRASDCKQEDFFGFLVALLVFVVAVVWDLASNFGIAAIVVERAGISGLCQSIQTADRKPPASDG
jgi:hypothetical protein